MFDMKNSACISFLSLFIFLTSCAGGGQSTGASIEGKASEQAAKPAAAPPAKPSAAPSSAPSVFPVQPIEVLKSMTLYQSADDPLFVKAFYQKTKIDNSASTNAMGANILYEQGKSKDWYVEEQKNGADYIEAGVYLKDEKLIDQGWKYFDWAFSRQGKDGGFTGTGDPYHSTDLFIESVARSLLEMKQAGDPSYDKYSGIYLEKLHAAALWMMKPEIEVTRHKNDNLTHRRWVSAAALGMTAELTGDQVLAKKAEDYAKEGLLLQTPEGINPEKGGFDVTYHNFGILLAERYYTVCHDEQLQLRILNMINKGMAYSLTKVLANGDVSTSDSTRVTSESDRSGNSKTPAYKSITQAFLIGYKLTDDVRFQDAAQKIANFKWSTK